MLLYSDTCLEPVNELLKGAFAKTCNSDSMWCHEGERHLADRQTPWGLLSAGGDHFKSQTIQRVSEVISPASHTPRLAPAYCARLVRVVRFRLPASMPPQSLNQKKPHRKYKQKLTLHGKRQNTHKNDHLMKLPKTLEYEIANFRSFHALIY